MARRLAAAVVVLLVAVSGCGLDHHPRAVDTAEPAAASPKPLKCERPRYRDVVGQRPNLKARRLSRYPNDRASCAGWWLPRIDPGFVPQGLALDGQSVWISGWSKSDKNIPFQTCRLMQVDLNTGRLLSYARVIKGYVGRSGPRICRHGDGVDITRRGIWLTETDRIWLLDPDRIGKTRMIKRAWRVNDPLRASVATIANRSLGLGVFTKKAPGRVDWFPIDSMMRRGVVDLWPGDLPKASRRRIFGANAANIPDMVQGITMSPDGSLVFARSVSRCGTLVVGKKNFGFLPGAEDIEYDGNGGLWALSESVALKTLSGGDRPVVPELVRFDVRTLMKGSRARCLAHPLLKPTKAH